MPCSLITVLFSCESNPESRVNADPRTSSRASRVNATNCVTVSGSKAQSCSFTGLTVIGAITNPLSSAIVSSFSPFWCLCPEYPMPSPLFLRPCLSHLHGVFVYPKARGYGVLWQRRQTTIDMIHRVTSDDAIYTHLSNAIHCAVSEVLSTEYRCVKHTGCSWKFCSMIILVLVLWIISLRWSLICRLKFFKETCFGSVL